MFNGFKRKKVFLEKERMLSSVPKIEEYKVEKPENNTPKVKKVKPSENLVKENNKDTKEQGNE